MNITTHLCLLKIAKARSKITFQSGKSPLLSHHNIFICSIMLQTKKGTKNSFDIGGFFFGLLAYKNDTETYY